MLRKEAMEVIRKHLRVKSSTTLRESILSEMIEHGLLKSLNQQKVMVINHDKSSRLESILEGNWRSQRRARA